MFCRKSKGNPDGDEMVCVVVCIIFKKVKKWEVTESRRDDNDGDFSVEDEDYNDKHEA